MAHLRVGSRVRAYSLANLSEGGLFLRTDHPLPVATPVVVDLVGRSLAGPIRLRGRVVSSLNPTYAFEHDVPAGMGVELHSVDEPVRCTLMRLIGLDPSDALSLCGAELASIQLL